MTTYTVRDRIATALGVDGLHWACLAGEGERKLRTFVEAALKTRAPGGVPHIVEIGTHQGVSACILADYGEVTTWDIKQWPLYDRVVEALKPRNRIERRLVRDNAHLARELAAITGAYDLAFVDGCHDYQPCLENFAAVRGCGRVVFHDYEHDAYTGRVVKVVDEIRDGRITKWSPFALWESLELVNGTRSAA